MDTDSEKDINSELDELDREEFYRLKKVNTWQLDSASMNPAKALNRCQGRSNVILLQQMLR